jgi:Xaa-Pro dipeptidase
MSAESLFNAHIRHLCANYERALLATGTPCDAILIHSGSEEFYYADDRGIPFQAWGHFLHWLPVNRPDQLVLVVPGEKPVYFQITPADFWYEQDIAQEDWWADQFEIHTLEDTSQVIPLLQGRGRIAFLGRETAFAEHAGILPSLWNPQELLHWLDYQRAIKTAYEVEQLRAANALALNGHLAARDAFLDGCSEYGIHQAFLDACNILEVESPYTNIVAVNEKSAILHYQNKRRASDGNLVLLIDAGCRINNYCSDITRTWAAPEAHPVFHSLISAVNSLQRELTELIIPGRPYLDLHVAAHEGITEILREHGIIRASFGEAMDKGVSRLFFPHGLGHLLGIQVHDTGGRLVSPAGDQQAPPSQYPALRTTRPIEAGQVFTVEPGLYFIPLLLEPVRTGRKDADGVGQLLDWPLIDELLPCGGIRIEDNVHVTTTGVENLTRQGAPRAA